MKTAFCDYIYMRTIELPTEISDGRVDSFIKILSEIRSGKITGALTLKFRESTKVTPGGYAILTIIEETGREYDCQIVFKKRPPTPPEIFLKAAGPGILPTLGAEIDRKFNDLSEQQIFRIKMILNELMQNAVDHSGSEKFILYAGLSEDEVHLGCLDRGITIPSKMNQKYEFANDLEYIEKSLLLGVTTRRIRAGGLGLTYVFDYAKLEQGRLVLISGDAQYRKYFSSRRSQKQKMKYKLHGSWIMVRFVRDA